MDEQAQQEMSGHGEASGSEFNNFGLASEESTEDVSSHGEIPRLQCNNLRNSPAYWNILQFASPSTENTSVAGSSQWAMDAWQQALSNEDGGDNQARKKRPAKPRRERVPKIELTWRVSLPRVGPETARESWQSLRKTISHLAVRKTPAFV